MKRHYIPVIAVFALTTACATPQRGRAPANQLESALEFKELTTANTEIPLSANTTTEPRKISPYAEVDINSTIEIDFAADKVKTSSNLPDSALMSKLSEDQKDLHQAISLLSQVVDARIAAIKAYEQKKLATASGVTADSTTATGFITAAKEFGRLEQKLTELPMWERATFTEEEQTRAFEDPTYKELGTLLQARLQDTENSLRTAIETANRSEARISLEAFLESPGASPIPIHLPGYDDLESKELQLKNNDALLISSKERKVLEEQFAAIRGFAYQAERLRTSEASLNAALAKAGKEAAARFPEIVEKAKPIYTTDWKSRGENLEAAIASFRTKLGQIPSGLAETEKTYWTGISSGISVNLTQTIPVSDIRNLSATLTVLRQNWQACSPETLLGTIQQTREAATQGLAIAAQLKKQGPGFAFDSWRRFSEAINTRPEGIKEETWKEVKQAAVESGLQGEIDNIQETVRDIQAFTAAVNQAIQFASVNPSQADIQVSKHFDVPLLSAPSTRLELQRTPRELNDRISFRATVSVGTETITSESVFSIRQFGWHSILAPSVILTRPINPRSTFDQDFKFAPAIAWTYKYYPRSWEEGWLATTARFLKVGGGLHLTFLDQAPNKDTEIGIGLALSFWDDRLVTGAGLDLMDNSRTYVYIGSNLIPILQALGFGDATNAGKKP